MIHFLPIPSTPNSWVYFKCNRGTQYSRHPIISLSTKFNSYLIFYNLIYSTILREFRYISGELYFGHLKFVTQIIWFFYQWWSVVVLWCLSFTQLLWCCCVLFLVVGTLWNDEYWSVMICVTETSTKPCWLGASMHPTSTRFDSRLDDQAQLNYEENYTTIRISRHFCTLLLLYCKILHN